MMRNHALLSEMAHCKTLIHQAFPSSHSFNASFSLSKWLLVLNEMLLLWDLKVLNLAFDYLNLIQ